jgi:hypothetical protein
MRGGLDSGNGLWLDNDMNTATTYTICEAPKFAGFRIWNCAECGHEELARPVFLAINGQTISVGTGCAAKLTGRPAAEFDADLAIARLGEIAANSENARQIWGWLRITLPGRITPKYIAETVARYRDAELVDTICGLYKVINRVGRVRAVEA